MIPTPKKNEVYAEFVCQEFNCLDCSGDTTSVKKLQPGGITSHIDWLYNSVNALNVSDIGLLGSEFFLLSPDYDDPHYPGGLIKALEDAMDRGAKICLLLERFYVGGRNKEGKCGTCLDTGKPFGCDTPPKVSIYPYFCEDMMDQVKRLDKHSNFVLIDVPYTQKDNMRIHSHFKIASFYYTKRKICSTFKGSWNFSTRKFGNFVKETGIGFIAPIESDWGQSHIHLDLLVLDTLENYYPNTANVAISLLKPLSTRFVKQPFNIPILYFRGPNYADNFGCGVGRECKFSETWVTTVDNNVNVWIGADPGPDTYEIGWDEHGWDKKNVWGETLVGKLIDGAKFLKTAMHSQFIEMGNGGYGNYSVPSSILASLRNFRKRGGEWKHIQNTGWENSDMGSLAYEMKTYKNFHPKSMGICNKIIPQTVDNPSTNLTHDKLWVSDTGVLFSSAHPVNIHYNVDLMNYDLLLTHCPNLTRYMNNHYNFMYNHCAVDIKGWGDGNKLITSTCPTGGNIDGYCIGKGYIITKSPIFYPDLTSDDEYVDKIIKGDTTLTSPGISMVPNRTNVTILIGVMLLLFYIYAYRKKKKVNWYLISGVIAGGVWWYVTRYQRKDIDNIRKYLMGMYPDAKDIDTFSDKGVVDYINNLGVIFPTYTDINPIEDISFIKTLYQQIVCPLSDCCPSYYGRWIDSDWCTDDKCNISDEYFDSRKYGILARQGDFYWLTAMDNQYANIVMRNPYSPADWTQANFLSPIKTFPLNNGGFGNNSEVEVFRVHSVSGSPDTYYYVASGSGNFLNIGKTLKSRDKVDAMLKLIQLAGKNNFSGFFKSPVIAGGRDTWSHRTTTDYRTFQDNPEQFLLELLETGGKYGYTTTEHDETFQFSMSIPTKGVMDFCNDIGLWNNNQYHQDCGPYGVEKPEEWKIWYKADAGHPSVKPLMIWYFEYRGVSPPDDFWYANMDKWSDEQAICLRNFFLNITDPTITLEPLLEVNFSWEARYVLNRVANSDIYDFLMFSLVIQNHKFSAPAMSITGNRWGGLDIDTIQFTTEPSGSGNWDYELVDYRFDMSSAKDPKTHKAIHDAPKIWDAYTTKWLKWGSDTDPKRICKFKFNVSDSFDVSHCKM